MRVTPLKNWGKAEPQYPRGRRKWDMEKWLRSRHLEIRIAGGFVRALSVRTQYDPRQICLSQCLCQCQCQWCLSIRRRFRSCRPWVFMSHISNAADTGASAPLQDDLCRPQRNMGISMGTWVHGPRGVVAVVSVVYYDAPERTNCRTNALFPEIMNSAHSAAYANMDEYANANLEGHKCNQLMSQRPPDEQLPTGSSFAALPIPWITEIATRRK